LFVLSYTNHPYIQSDRCYVATVKNLGTVYVVSCRRSGCGMESPHYDTAYPIHAGFLY